MNISASQNRSIILVWKSL